MAEIKTMEDYTVAMAEIGLLMDKEDIKGPDADRLRELADATSNFENTSRRFHPHPQETFGVIRSDTAPISPEEPGF